MRDCSRRKLLGVVASVGVAGCLGAPTQEATESAQQPTESPTATAEPTPTYDLTVENLEIPWDLAFAPTGDLFLTERTGRVVRYAANEVTAVAELADAAESESLPAGSEESSWWLAGGEGGTLEVAVHPNYSEPPLVYVYYTYRDEADERYNKVVSVDVSAEDPSATATPLVEEIPPDSYHNGGRIGFGPANYLWVTTGDAGEPERAHRTPAGSAGRSCGSNPTAAPPWTTRTSVPTRTPASTATATGTRRASRGSRTGRR